MHTWSLPSQLIRRSLLLQANPQVLSKNGNHLVYTRPHSEPGDSGGLLIEDGGLVGMHVEGVLHLKEWYKRNKGVGTSSKIC